MDSARHVRGCKASQETRVQNAFDDVASTIHQSLPFSDPRWPHTHTVHTAGITRSRRQQKVKLDVPHGVAAQVEIESKV